MSQRSLIGQIIVRMSVLTAVTLVLIMVLLGAHFRSSANALRDRELYALTERIADHLMVGGGDALVFRDRAEFDDLVDPSGNISYTIHDITGRILLASQADATEPVHPFRPHYAGKIDYFQHTDGLGDETHYGATVFRKIDGRPVWIQVAKAVGEGDGFAELIVPVLMEGAGWVVVPFFIGLLLINIFSIRQSLSPVRLASERAAAIGPDTGELRLPVGGMPGEITPLIEAVNAALDRLDKALIAQKQFTADAAHELLTPLAVLTAHIDTLEDRQTASELRGDVADMSHVVTQLLVMAELESGSPKSDRPVDLREICIDTLARLAPLALERGKTLVMTGTEGAVMVLGSEQMLARALRNLVDNAVAHTPAGTTVEVNLEQGATIRVIDDGPGIPPEQRDLIFRRFWRGDRNRPGGTGLGLSIVSSIVENLDGTMEVGATPEGGTIFTLRFPQAAAPPAAIEPERRPVAQDRSEPQTAG